jgi:hypothetical protein
MLLPFFNDIMGLIGAMPLWLLTVYFLVEMYISQTSIKKWVRKWILLQFLSLVFLLVTLVVSIRSVARITISLKHATVFNMKY